MSEPTEAEVLLRLVDAAKTAAGCAWQMTHMQQNTNWLIFRDLLEQVAQDAVVLATAKPMGRQALLAAADQRAAAHQVVRH